MRRSIDLLFALATGNGGVAIGDAARRLGLPPSTAHRIAAELTRCGLLVRVGHGRYMTGFGLIGLGRKVSPAEVLKGVARPVLKLLAHQTGRTAHLGQFEADMVTYLVREGPARAQLFTRESMQLEAYCSAIGKILLTRQTPEDLDAYLGTGYFVPLTSHTLIDPAKIRAHLQEVAVAGVAIDDEEIENGLFCMAVPVEAPSICGPVALSLAGAVPDEPTRAHLLSALRRASAELAVQLGPDRGFRKDPGDDSLAGAM